MRTTINQRIRRERIRIVLGGIIAFFAVLFVLGAVFAAAITIFEMPASARGLFSAITVAAASFAAAFIPSRRRRCGGIFIGIIVSIAVIFMITVGSAVTLADSSVAGTFAKCVLVVVSALTGGIYGVNSKPRI
jgi:putative membrane protein (TIGR04086 family)